MYVHIGDTVSVPIESIITMVHAKGGKSHKSPIHHYELRVYRHGTRGADQDICGH